MMKLGKSLLALMLALVLVFSLVGCQETDAGETSEPADVVEPDEIEESLYDEALTVGDKTPDFTEDVTERSEENDDTIGWLQVPNTFVDDVVVMHDSDNEFYRRRNFFKEYDFNGIFYADYRSTLGDGTRKDLGLNTCIYGHALTDNDEDANYNVMFGSLHDLQDPDLARDIPYINFSTAQENMTFEIFAVFIANADNPDLPYNSNKVEPKDFYDMIQNEVLPRSFYNYNVEVSENDRFLTLSTCIYNLPDGRNTNYPDTYIRYAIMAKLVEPDEPLKKYADFTINEDFVLDDDGPISSAR